MYLTWTRIPSTFWSKFKRLIHARSSFSFVDSSNFIVSVSIPNLNIYIKKKKNYNFLYPNDISINIV
jgi:hypothetical protein